MKHCAYFSILAALCLTAISCTKHDELEFSGKVLWIRECTTSFLDTNVGYVVTLDHPEGIGADIVTEDGVALSNIIVLYEPTTHIYVDDYISGKFYIDNRYSRAHCSLKYDDFELPEGVFTKVRSLDGNKPMRQKENSLTFFTPRKKMSTF